MPPKRKLSQPAVFERDATGRSDDPALTDIRVLGDEVAFAAALDAFGGLDPAFMTTLRAAAALPQLRRREPGFAGLAAIIVAQQLSTASANAIFGRLQVRFPDLCPLDVIGASDADLRLCGLSAPKIRTLRAIAAAAACGSLDFTALAAAEADAAHAALCAVSGIGPWTADVFLLFCLGHADAWPAGDLALQEGARLMLGLPERPSTKVLQTLGDRWRPLRGVAAHCLWAYYGAMRSRPTTLEASDAPGRTHPAAPTAAARPTHRPKPARTSRPKRLDP